MSAHKVALDELLARMGYIRTGAGGERLDMLDTMVPVCIVEDCREIAPYLSPRHFAMGQMITAAALAEHSGFFVRAGRGGVVVHGWWPVASHGVFWWLSDTQVFAAQSGPLVLSVMGGGPPLVTTVETCRVAAANVPANAMQQVQVNDPRNQPQELYIAPGMVLVVVHDTANTATELNVWGREIPAATNP